MVYSLSLHQQGYGMSFGEAICSLVWSPYASRHSDLAFSGPKESRLYHRVVSVIERIPGVGFALTLIELIVNWVSNLFSNSKLTPEQEKRRNMIDKTMLDNSRLALDKARKSVKESPYIVTPAEARQTIPDSVEQFIVNEEHPKLYLHYSDDCLQGPFRPDMQDEHMSKIEGDFEFHAVFDGHGVGGEKVARIAKEVFESEFSAKAFCCDEENKIEAFNKIINRAHAQVKNEKLEGGSTAVIAVVDKKMRRVFIATLGDAEARLYRKINGQFKVVPLSLTQDWTCNEDKERAIKMNTLPVGTGEPKQIRVLGTNVARSIGDLHIRAISQEPKVTVARLEEGDHLILACDGLFDHANNGEIASIIQKNETAETANDLAKRLIQLSIANQRKVGYGDNVSVIALRCVPPATAPERAL